MPQVLRLGRRHEQTCGNRRRSAGEDPVSGLEGEAGASTQEAFREEGRAAEAPGRQDPDRQAGGDSAQTADSDAAAGGPQEAAEASSRAPVASGNAEPCGRQGNVHDRLAA
ncbi:MAG: hypothetical protein ACRDNI_02730 [Gaiellaceae bacterium]